MNRPSHFLTCLAAGLLAMTVPGVIRADDDLADLQEKAVKAAVKYVAPSVVLIDASGGTEIVSTGPRGPRIRKGDGPTTGLIVGADGYVISSAFNFANKPTTIAVRIPSREKAYAAEVVATDTTRQLTLLRLKDATGLRVPTPAPKAGFLVGQTAIAVGRTLPSAVETMPSVSVGVVSALGRVWGTALQTDAKVSPSNYGGPLIDLQGRVLGVLVPLSPRAKDEIAGVEWYDSGIGFAIPLEDINAVLERLKKGKDLKPGLLGVNLRPAENKVAPPEVASVAPGSAAEKAGFKAGDKIVSIAGKPINSVAQMRHQLGYRYEGDTISVKLQRGKEEITLPAVTLAGSATLTKTAFLGIIPVRDDADPGVEVRYVYPKSAAEAAGLKVGDRIKKVGSVVPGQPEAWQNLANRDKLAALLDNARPGMELKLDVIRGEDKKVVTLDVKLGEMNEDVPLELPEKATAKKALGKESKPFEKKAEIVDKKTTASGDRSYTVYVPADYDPNIAYGVVVWMHPLNKNKDTDVDDFINTWWRFASRHHLILILPKAEGEAGWTPGDADFVAEAVKAVSESYTIDKRRIIAHGQGQGGQMALYLGFNNRSLFRGVATSGAALSSNPKDPQAEQPLSFFLVAGSRDPLKDAVKASATKLEAAKYPVALRVIQDFGAEYMDRVTLDELVRWVDSLDRM